MAELITSPQTYEYDESTMQRLMVDAEHTGIRIVLPFLAVGGFILVYGGLPSVLKALSVPEPWLSLLTSIPAGLVAAVLVLMAGDRVLKRIWPSQHALLLGDRHLVLRRPKRPDQVFRWEERINTLAWCFRVPRRGRIPKGHWCIALQLLQDETQITIYTFASPKEGEKLEGFEAFTPLASNRKNKDKQDSLRAAGQQRRLLQAERERWQNGAELSLEDFKVVWATLRQHGTVLEP